jgi:hypothetical protein
LGRHAAWRLAVRIAALASRWYADVQHSKESAHPADRSKEPHALVLPVGGWERNPTDEYNDVD